MSRSVAGAQTPEVNTAAAITPEEILAFAVRIDELARAHAGHQIFDWCTDTVHELEGLLINVRDLTAEGENWPVEEDEDAERYGGYVAPPLWQHATDAMEKIRTGLDDIIRERDERRRAEWRRQKEKQRAEGRKAKRIESLRSQLRALEGEAVQPGGGGE
jgi:hypothetical protein